jgi:hypothetical protein
MNRRTKFSAGIGRQLGALAAMLAVSGTASAGIYNDGKVLLTGGVSITDGAGGGGITPWAAITGYETRDGINGDLHYTYAQLPNYSLNSIGAAVGLFDRVEVSYANDTLPTNNTYDTVGLAAATTGGLTGTTVGGGIEPFNTTIYMNVFGLKVRVLGDAIYNSDSFIPQVAVGGFYKMNENKDLLKTLGADKTKDFEAYICATKIFFPISTLVNFTVRYSGANETGLTGFGGNGKDHRTVRMEGSIAYLLNKGTAIGGEWAQHSEHLGGNLNLAGSGGTSSTLSAALPLVDSLTGSTLVQKESDWKDLFVAFAPSKNLSIVLAYAQLGNIVLTPHQTGFYASMQASF